MAKILKDVVQQLLNVAAISTESAEYVLDLIRQDRLDDAFRYLADAE